MSFVERKKSDTTLAKQYKVLRLTDYFSTLLSCSIRWEDGASLRVEGTEANRQMLKEAVKAGRVRKVLVKYDVPVTDSLTRDNLLDQLMEGFQLITPYFDSCQDANKLLEDWCKRGE